MECLFVSSVMPSNMVMDAARNQYGQNLLIYQSVWLELQMTTTSILTLNASHYSNNVTVRLHLGTELHQAASSVDNPAM